MIKKILLNTVLSAVLFTTFLSFQAFNVNANNDSQNNSQIIKDAINKDTYDEKGIKIVKILNLSFHESSLPENGENVLMQLDELPSHRRYLLGEFNNESNKIEKFYEGELIQQAKYRFKGLRKSGKYVLLTASLKGKSIFNTKLIILIVIIIIFILGIAFYLKNKNNTSKENLIEQKEMEE